MVQEDIPQFKQAVIGISVLPAALLAATCIRPKTI